jgi:Zn-dependent metalloprotease
MYKEGDIMDNITPAQQALLEQLRALDPALRLRWSEARGAASSVRGRLAQLSGSTLQDFLNVYGPLFGLPDPVRSLKLLRERTDDLGWKHVEYQQIHRAQLAWWQTKTVEVYGARLAAHIQPDGTLVEVQSSCWPDVRLDARRRVSAYKLRRILTQAIADHPDFGRFSRATRLHERKDLHGMLMRPGRGLLRALYQALLKLLRQERFPIMLTPQIFIYPWGRSFRIVWEAYAYTAAEKATRPGNARTPSRVEFGQVFVDATTREIFLFAPSRRDAETPDTGSGLGVTPLSGPFVSRGLNIVRVDGGATYRLRDTTHARDIITFDCANDPFWSDWEIKYGIHNGTLPVSQDIEGDKCWNRLPVDTTEAGRAASQQPEVDAHFYGREAYEWYNALAGAAGRAGWDDNNYSNPPVPPQPVRVLVHRQQGDAMDMNAYADFETVDGLFYYWLVFGEGIPDATCSTPGDRARSYMAGAKSTFGHEYQHAITDFSFTTSLDRPGLPFASGWFQAIHEGLSDTFGCMFSENWHLGSEVSPTGLASRNLAFPRDPNTLHNMPWTGEFCGSGGSAKDHFDDRDTNIQSGYDRGTILAHCAYLMGEGGVHQRSVRTPVLIPVQGLGRETTGGKEVLKAARIWYRALTWYYSTHGIATERPEDNEVEFRELRDACESAAIDLYGNGSPEHRTTVLAFYAVGLHPVGEAYGADPTFLSWGWNWRFSRPYLGGILGTAPDWSSLDLFINNGGISEWNALINIDTPGGPTQFENMLYCRIRNVGDQPAENVQVQFEYAKAGTATTVWLPVTDKDGNPQSLDLGTLGAGQSSFSESDQNTPPASAGVKWYIPPLEPGETVNHFCLRATVSASNDVNPYTNVVQSNIAYIPYSSSKSFQLNFLVGNPTQKPIPVRLAVRTSLPEGWQVQIAGDYENMRLDPGERRELPIVIHMLPGADRCLTPPFDGAVQGRLFGHLCGSFEGTLSETRWDGKRLLGRLTATVPELGTFHGTFNTKLNADTGEIKGRASGKWQCDAGNRRDEWMCVGVQGYLRPLRRVDVSQLIEGQPVGGITIQVQVPVPDNPYAGPFPPTDTYVTPG